MLISNNPPEAGKPTRIPSRTRKHSAVSPLRVSTYGHETYSAQDALQQQAELFYLQKQIQARTPMVFVLEDGEQIEGCIEWYDRNSLKVRGQTKSLIYKSAIKYMYKHGDQGW